MATIYEQLKQAAGNIDQQPEEKDTEYLRRLCETIAKASDETWNSLTLEAQAWFNDAAAAFNRLKPDEVPSLEGYKGQGKATPKPPKVTEMKKPEPKKEAPKKVRADGAIDAIRRTLILHPDWTNKQVHEYLNANGQPSLKIETVAVNAGDIRKTIIMATQMGFWNQDAYIKEKKAEAPAPVPAGS